VTRGGGALGAGRAWIMKSLFLIEAGPNFFDISFLIVSNRVTLSSLTAGRQLAASVEAAVGRQRRERKKSLGGQRKPLKRLKTAKRIQGNPSFFL
jgi:hypothetical protein